MKRPENCIITIFGASGDLTKRKLIPALFDIYQRDLMPEQFAVVGTGRTEFSSEEFRKQMDMALDTFYPKDETDSSKKKEFLKQLFYLSGDSNSSEIYPSLLKMLNEIDSRIQSQQRFMYYLATAPPLFSAIAKNLGEAGMNIESSQGFWKRIVIEKPFGMCLESAKALNRELLDYFSEAQIYRIDHYLGKETVQNLLAFRFANGIFEPLWNRNYIHNVQVTAAESLGVENRGGYYDQSGALRDMVQNHLLQLIAVTAMEPPSSFTASAVRNEKVKVFQSLAGLDPASIPRRVIRGQYIASAIDGKAVKSYREENDVNPDSRTETFVAMKLNIDNWRWGGVPIYLRTGKYLPTRVTEVVINFKPTPHSLFARDFSDYQNANQLILRIQPDEGILLKFGMKKPGTGFDIHTVDMDFHYADLGTSPLPDAYERLLEDCLLGDATQYTRADAVEACWEYIQPILDHWKIAPEMSLYGYPAGTWGPKEAQSLFENPGDFWHHPCSEITSTDGFCKL